jgi:UDP-N-acetylmuramoyl-tripeptide--D-alanyl-D-alanine ligase
MREAILNFATSPLPNKVLWIGGMKEMGDAEQDEHNELVQLIAGLQWRNVILVGREFSNVAHAFTWFADSREAAAYIRTAMPENCAILIKGSRGSKMEIMLDALDQ